MTQPASLSPADPREDGSAYQAQGPAALPDGRWLWEAHYPERVSWRAPILEKPLFYLFDHAVETYGDMPAADFMGRGWTYRQLGGLIDRAAAGLQALGVKKGVKVGLFLPNTPYSIIFYFGVLKAGGTVVNYNPLYVEKELVHQIADSETQIMVTADLRLTLDKMKALVDTTGLEKVVVCPFAAALPFPQNLLFPLFKFKDAGSMPDDARFIRYNRLMDNAGKPQPVVVDPHEDIAVLQYTGGTTGTPKGACLTHGNLFANVMQASAWFGKAEAGRDCMVGVLPFFHVFAMTVVMNWSVWNGVRILLQPKFEIKSVFRLIKKFRPRFFPAVPAIYNAIATHADVGKYDFSCLKFCLSGGAPLPGDVKRLFEEKTGSNAIAEGYGLTESAPIVSVNPLGAANKSGSIGQPIPQTIVDIVDSETGELVPLGEKGEVCVRGPQVMQGYYKQREETDKVLKGGRLHTGDVGYIDSEGYVFLVDRIKDLILVRGYNVYPRVVEEAIYQHPAVEECIVAGVPDAERGETVWAWVKPVAGRTVTEDEIKDFVKDKLNPIEYPRKVIVREKPLPKTTVGKLSRKDLLAEEGITRAAK